MLKVICLVVAFIFNSINITYACHYENIKVETNGEIKGHLVPCNDENCPTFQQLLKQKENVVFEKDISKNNTNDFPTLTPDMPVK